MEDRKSLRILVVENHPDTVKWLQLFLEDLGHTVTAVQTVAAATDALNGNDWEVMISDIGLPDGLGWELLEKRYIKRAAFAIAMSGFGMNADSARSRAAGFQHHLLKPFKTSELEKLLDDASKQVNALVRVAR